MKLFRVFLILAVSTVFVSSAIASDRDDLKLQTVNNVVFEDRPATAVQQFFYAFIKKDVAMLKKRLTKQTLEFMKEGAKKKEMTLDEALKAYMDTEPFTMKRTPQMQKQKLDGDKCTIEAYLEGKWEVVPLVREDEIWRVDFMAMG